MWANLVAALVIAGLRYLSARHDLKKSVRLKLEVEAHKYATKALEHKLANYPSVDDDPRHVFRVHGFDKSRDLPTRDPGTPDPERTDKEDGGDDVPPVKGSEGHNEMGFYPRT